MTDKAQSSGHGAGVELGPDDLRAVAAYAAACARRVLELFERERPGDRRPREAIDAALAFAAGGERVKRIRDCAWAAQRAVTEAREAAQPAASEAARSALAAAGAAFLHPLAKATQVKHILGSAAHAALALELAAENAPGLGETSIARFAEAASPAVIDVLRRYPPAPAGGGRAGDLMRRLDALLRERGARPAQGARP
ncbi:hypothetical protein Ade02nite_53970 [Paractinoplanes deccanensis]|uniref:Imm-5-like domain-containing protein n=1 Tax=Paractinoplanes deccanensis TaxID=113561 RepID=A0ABQ3Y9X9_9ACTN|nr:exonuclease SbcC [Actinoplanes deccanensis]GID76756.1 hypothetical protein Ade02nite_53970 [Actinoplanes deccanensis]